MTYFKLKQVFLLGVFLFTLLSNQAQTIPSKIDSLLENLYKINAPGATVLVAKNGNILYRKSFGVANLELEVAMKPENVFQIASMTKQFTAISILMLVEQGKLKLTDEITQFIPEFPTHNNKITIHHLLTHTSGIKNYTRIRALNKKSKNDMTPIEIINFFKDKPMDFSPGEAFRYNNSGYFILGHIIEKVSGQVYEDFIQKNIFDPIGMSSSLYGSHTKVIKNRATGYAYKKNYRNTNYMSFTYPYAAGSIMSTVDDLLKWQHALTSHTLVSSELLQKAFTNYRLTNGNPIFYGYGWDISAVNGQRSIEHGGRIAGFKSHAIYLPSTNIYVVMLSNSDRNSRTKTELVAKIAAIASNNEYPKLEDRVVLSPKQLKKWVGAYKFKDKSIRFITLKDGQLYSQKEHGRPFKIIPVSKNTFLFDDGLISYTFSKKKGKRMATFIDRTGKYAGVETTKKPPVAPKSITVNNGILKQYIGTYQMNANFNIVITVKGNQIFAQATGQSQFELFAKTKTEFFLKRIVATVIFTKNDLGTIVSLTLKQGGRAMVLKRVD